MQPYVNNKSKHYEFKHHDLPGHEKNTHIANRTLQPVKYVVVWLCGKCWAMS